MIVHTHRQTTLIQEGAGDPGALDRYLANGALNSDHSPLSCDVPGLGIVVTYNVMTRMLARGGRPNNGFGRTETLDGYRSRLRRIAAELVELSQGGAVVLALQEAPAAPRFALTLREGLPASWNALWMRTAGERFAQGILCNRGHVRATEVDPPNGLGPQAGRVQVVVLMGGASPVTFVNVHFAWDASCDEAVRILDRLPPQLVVAGDFNRPPESVAVAGTTCLVPRTPTSIRHTAAGPALNAVDGFFVGAPGAYGPALRDYWAYSFTVRRSLESMRASLAGAGPWDWQLRDSAWYGEYLQSRPVPGVRVRIHELRGRRTVLAQIDHGAEAQREEIDGAIRSLLQRIAASEVRSIEPYD